MGAGHGGDTFGEMIGAMKWLILAGLLTSLLAAPMLGADAAAQGRPLQLSLPIACEPGKNCFVQNYVDHDPGPGVKDYACSSRTYNGHDGIDFRIPDIKAMRDGVPVLAAAAGKVLRLRNDVEDIDPRQRPPLATDRYCGNGLIVDDGGGWQTQYCHLRRGSIVVKPGQVVAAGEKLGLVGQSGEAEFPHVHLTVRQGGKAVDPFAYGAAPNTCRAGTSLWSSAVAAKLAFRQTEVINTGFAGATVDAAAIEAGAIAPPTRTSPVLIAYVRVIGLKAGDREELSLMRPDGSVMAKPPANAVPRDQAQRFWFVGGRARGPSWPTGVYHAAYSVQRGGKTVVERKFDLRL